MSNVEAENISRYLRTKEIQLPINNRWLLDCINWYKSHSGLRNIYNSLEDYVCIQWLLSDLRDVQHCCLPTNAKDATIQLTSKYCVQVNWTRDISQPCYTQLQAMTNVNIADSNENVTAEETKKQNWEPSPKRVLMMEVTDGCTTLKAMEYLPIHKLTEPLIPGFKVVLIGPIECRKGVLFLKNNNISLLGGEVDYLSDLYSKENILSRCLNIIDTPNEDSSRYTNDPVTANSPPVETMRPQQFPVATNSPPVETMRPQQLFNDLNQLPDSTSFIESNPFQDNSNSMMEDDDDDDDILCQLPDTMFNDAYNSDLQPNRLSPVLDRNSTDEVHSSIQENAEKVPVLINTAKNTKKPTSFSSLEDLRPEKGSLYSTNVKQSILTINAKQSLPGSSLDNKSANSSNKPLYEKANVLLNTVPVEQSPVLLELHDENESLINCIDDDLLDENGDRNVYPQFKRLRVKVMSITKLKIRNGEWVCCASVSVEDKNENVTFCNKVLDKLFGTSAAEVEVLRSEMAKNQSLKEKVNDILKAGQTKLKLLNCWMIVEYTSDDCTPNIVSVHEES